MRPSRAAVGDVAEDNEEEGEEGEGVGVKGEMRNM
jgi:hypothetical protein